MVENRHILKVENLTAFLRSVITMLVVLLCPLSLVFADNIPVGGPLTEDQTWTSDNTYIVVQDLRVGSGVTLTILPGTVVKVDQGRGIQIWGGNLLVGDHSGIDADSVYFRGNYSLVREGWKWKGITIRGLSDEGTVVISYASIQDAEIGLDLIQSTGVLLQYSTLSQNQNLGMRIMDCSHCIVQSCVIDQNYNGIELRASSLFTCSSNHILNNRIINTNHNLYLVKEEGGALKRNEIAHNLIQDANNGIWMDNPGAGSSSENVISNNYFVSNGGGFGFGILVAFDSTEIKNNIFWQNNMALTFDPIAVGGTVTNNSFYQNMVSIQVRENCTGNSITYNTFSHQVLADFETKVVSGVSFSLNNIFPDNYSFPIVINMSPGDLLVENNYWGTNQQNLIDSLIWDKQDDPDVGNLIHVPYLLEPDTSVPVSPPFGVKKQLVADQLKLSWDKNPERDITGYKVYSGTFEYYQFEESIDVGLNQSVLLDGSFLNDSLAVTAYDKDGFLENAQLSGFESPFAFATYYPYAGEESEICGNETMFKLLNSTAPFSYELLNWTTSGDGYFNDRFLLRPIYFPGDEDKLTGHVNLLINVLKNGSWFIDSLRLNILDNVLLFAGNDTTIFNDEQVVLDQAFEIDAAYINWSSTGDGTFNGDTLVNAIYFPGEADINNGYVTLILAGINTCSDDVDSIRLDIVARYTIHGAVWHNNEPVSVCALLAFEQSASQTSVKGVTFTDMDGQFMFNSLTPSDYLLYAVPDTNFSDAFYPGYYVNPGRWQEAYALKLNADIYDIDIQLPSLNYTLPYGDGSITGAFLPGTLSPENETVYCQSWFSSGFSYPACRNGQSNITILLLNSTQEKVLAYTLTDADGRFYFKNLPMGSYVIDAEKAGYLSIASPVISLTPEFSHESGIVLEIGDQKIGIYRQITPYINSNIEVFPNPAADALQIPLTFPLEVDAQIEVYDVFGNRVLQNSIPHNHDIYTLNTNSLSSGLYLGRIVILNQTMNFRFVKK